MAKSAEEMSHWSEYHYVVVNRDLDASVSEVEAIVTGERLRRTRQIGLADFVNRLRGGWPAPMKVTGRAEFVVPTGGRTL